MRLLEVFKELVKIYVEHGDIEVERYNDCCCYGNSEHLVTGVEAQLPAKDGYEASVLIS